MRPERSNSSPSTFVESILETYYSAANLDGLMKQLDLLVMRGEDPKREARINAAQSVGLVGMSAAKRMSNFLMKELELA